MPHEGRDQYWQILCVFGMDCVQRITKPNPTANRWQRERTTLLYERVTWRRESERVHDRGYCSPFGSRLDGYGVHGAFRAVQYK